MQEIRQLLSQGLTVRQVAAQTGYSRKEVQQVFETMQGERNTNVGKWLTILAIIAVVVGGVFFLIARHNEAVKMANDPVTWKPAVNNAISGLRRTFGPDKWLLEEDNNTDEVIHREVQITKEYSQRLDDALTANANIPEVKILKDEFGGKFYTTMFSPNFGGTSRKIYFNKDEAVKPQPAGTLEVCFFPRNAQNHPRIKGQLLFYANDWRSLFIGALDYLDKRWFDALAIHELWHAHMHKIGAASATAPTLSDLWVSEELQAHKLENEVLNNGTKGEYLTTVHIIAQSIEGKVLGDFLKQITADRLIQLNRLFSEGSDREGSLRTDQYLLTLMNDWLSQRYQGEELQRQQAEAYRILSRDF